eukprot:CAMPEP_0171787908 /NCGR_PEP_ID=MMETSP0991-20121206/64181_1 /TAXON_ID=483369 /ORGANISM="non described non described, Strain CCMP2098" /LENGTH=126 /DNA_ID=CAMNT_0012396951 /DNA_START=91 /DNA_END=468 /DNA_ORIENTATION=+
MAGTPKPKNVAFKDWMYSCFKEDVSWGGSRWNDKIPEHKHFAPSLLVDTSSDKSGGGTFRVVTFNVHFFRVGFSSTIIGDSLGECLDVIAALSADVLLLQEVPASLVGPVTIRLKALGFPHPTFAG